VRAWRWARELLYHPSMRSNFQIGDVIADKYVLHERLGAGGMGVVYRASQPVLARTVAIKLLYRELAEDPQFVRRFQDEAIAASRISHPNSVAVIEWGHTTDGTPFIVMEDVHGVTITHLVQRSGSMPIGRALELIHQLLEALVEAHAADVIHGDVKSDNVLVEATRTGDRVRVIDFGLARLRDRPGLEDIRVDAAGDRLISGTPEYMAPEVIRGEPPTPATDLYGAGIILYELLTGTTPFAGGTTTAIMERHLHDPVVPPSVRRPDRGISLALDRAVVVALAKDPASRFPDVATFAATLAAIGVTREPIDDPRCACGARCPRSAQFCPTCGAAQADDPEATERPTRNWRATTSPAVAAGAPNLARGSELPELLPSERERRLRHAIGGAITAGDLTAITEGYIALARLLVASQRLGAAVVELEEAVDVVTAGGGPRAADAPGPVGVLLAELATVSRANGDGVRARRAAALIQHHQTVH